MSTDQTFQALQKRFFEAMTVLEKATGECRRFTNPENIAFVQKASAELLAVSRDYYRARREREEAREEDERLKINGEDVADQQDLHDKVVELDKKFKPLSPAEKWLRYSPILAEAMTLFGDTDDARTKAKAKYKEKYGEEYSGDGMIAYGLKLRSSGLFTVSEIRDMIGFQKLDNTTLPGGQEATEGCHNRE